MVMCFNLVTHVLKTTGKWKSEEVNFCIVTTEVIFQTILQNVTWLFALTSWPAGKRKVLNAVSFCSVITEMGFQS